MEEFFPCRGSCGCVLHEGGRGVEKVEEQFTQRTGDVVEFWGFYIGEGLVGEGTSKAEDVGGCGDVYGVAGVGLEKRCDQFDGIFFEGREGGR